MPWARKDDLTYCLQFTLPVYLSSSYIYEKKIQNKKAHFNFRFSVASIYCEHSLVWLNSHLLLVEEIYRVRLPENFRFFVKPRDRNTKLGRTIITFPTNTPTTASPNHWFVLVLVTCDGAGVFFKCWGGGRGGGSEQQLGRGQWSVVGRAASHSYHQPPPTCRRNGHNQPSTTPHLPRILCSRPPSRHTSFNTGTVFHSS